eukprot:GHVR01171604.1.p1 GENE.GHVR01171604.1~~GHVR01171604.1.p1  ORF type:complete len:170 (+),score=54.16 GHVR01171604.1:60-569(+)
MQSNAVEYSERILFSKYSGDNENIQINNRQDDELRPCNRVDASVYLPSTASADKPYAYLKNKAKNTNSELVQSTTRDDRHCHSSGESVGSLFSNNSSKKFLYEADTHTHTHTHTHTESVCVPHLSQSCKKNKNIPVNIPFYKNIPIISPHEVDEFEEKRKKKKKKKKRV